MRCADCEEDFDEEDITVVKDGRKKVKLCEECIEVRREEGAMAEEAEGAMRDMMEYKGGW
jgi:NAD-dependent SIR2 family protein deacetylase